MGEIVGTKRYVSPPPTMGGGGGGMTPMHTHKKTGGYKHCPTVTWAYMQVFPVL